MNCKMAWSTNYGVMIVASTDGDIADSDWDRILADMEKYPINNYLGVTTGTTTATPLQRKRVSDILTRRGISTAIITDSRLTRGLVTAVSWFTKNIKAYSHADLSIALARLNLTPQEQGAIKDITTKLLIQVGQ